MRTMREREKEAATWLGGGDGGGQRGVRERRVARVPFVVAWCLREGINRKIPVKCGKVGTRVHKIFSL